jgi:hypothetical protein
MKEIIEYITSNWETVLVSVWGILTAIATVTPTGKDNTWLEKVGAFADRFGIQLKSPKE